LLNDRALKLGKYAHHLEHRLSGWRGRVQTLLMQEKVDTKGMNLRQKPDQILQTAAEAINAPGHNHIELALCRIAAKGVECRAPVPDLSAADAMVLVDLDDLAAHASGNIAQFPLLIGRGLLDCGHPEIENRTSHWKAPVDAWRDYPN